MNLNVLKTLKQLLLTAVFCLGLAYGYAETEEPDAYREQAMMTQVATGQRDLREALRAVLRKHLLNLRLAPSKGATLTTDTIAAVPAAATISMTKSTMTTTTSFSSTTKRGTGEEEELVENRVEAQPTIR